MRSKGLDGAALRIIAMATMLADHIGWSFVKNPMILTWIGRIAFPIYAFLLAEGFLIISLYNGELGYHEKWFRKLYASFYPLHLYVVGIIYVLTGH